MKAKRSFGDIFAKYKTYDPKVEGYGSAEQWSDSFFSRMGFEEAEEVLYGQNDTPRGLLGVGLKATWDEIKKAYRTKAMQFHPDRCGINQMKREDAEEMFKKISAAFTVLEREFGK